MAREQGAERRPSEEQQAEEKLRVRSEEFYPIVGDPLENLRTIGNVFGERGGQIAQDVVEGVRSGQIHHASLELRKTGDNAPMFRIEITRGTGDYDISMQLLGDWTSMEEIPSGHPLLANFDGKFFRKMRQTDENPLVEEGKMLEPDAPIGIAMAGKTNRWLYRLPKTEFPKGARLLRFVHPDGEQVVKGETIICYVEKTT